MTALSRLGLSSLPGRAVQTRVHFTLRSGVLRNRPAWLKPKARIVGIKGANDAIPIKIKHAEWARIASVVSPVQVRKRLVTCLSDFRSAGAARHLVRRLIHG